MSSTQGDNHEFQYPSSAAGSDADMSMYRDRVGYGSQPSEGPDQEQGFHGVGESEQEPAESNGGGFTSGGRGSPNSGEGYNAGDQDDESVTIAPNLKTMIQEIIQQTQATLEGLLGNVITINGSSVDVTEALQIARDSAGARKSKLEEDREKVHQAACRVLEVLDITNNAIDGARPQLVSDGEDRGQNE